MNSELDEASDVGLDDEVTSLDVVLVVVSLEVGVSVEVDEPSSLGVSERLGRTISHDVSNKVIKPIETNSCFFMVFTFKVFYHFQS